MVSWYYIFRGHGKLVSCHAKEIFVLKAIANIAEKRKGAKPRVIRLEPPVWGRVI